MKKYAIAYLIPILVLGAGIGLFFPLASDPQGIPAGGVPSGQTATLLPDGRWLLGGGVGEQGPLATAQIWNPQTEVTASVSQSLQHCRAWHSATVLPDGNV